MYKITKNISFKDYLKQLPSKEQNSLAKKYKGMFEWIEANSKEELIEESIAFNLRNYLYSANDTKLKDLRQILNSIEIEEINQELLDKDFFFLQNQEIIIPEEHLKIIKRLDIDYFYQDKLKTTILFYMNANGVLELDKLLELIRDTDLTITKQELKNHLKELDLKLTNNLVYLNEFAFDFNKRFNLLEKKKSLQAGYLVYSLDNIIEAKNHLEEKDYLIQIYNNFKDEIYNDSKRFEVANTIYNYIRCGYNFEENINNYFKTLMIDGNEYQIKTINELVHNIYFDVPLWELNGYYQNKELLDRQDNVATYVNMYLIMNGTIELDKLLDMLNNYHHLEIVEDDIITEEDIYEIIEILGDIKIKNNYLYLDSLDDEILQKLIIEKNKIKKYRFIDNIDNFFEEFDKNQEKLTKLVQKYTDNKLIINHISSLINIGFFNEFTLETSLKSEKIYLPSNKIDRMYKDLINYQKNHRTWILNGYTPNEIKLFKIR